MTSPVITIHLRQWKDFWTKQNGRRMAPAGYECGQMNFTDAGRLLDHLESNRPSDLGRLIYAAAFFGVIRPRLIRTSAI
ncbi:hypothetical protein CLV41_106151 [Roseibium marinum]|uniref:Uncharacterized protein n=1 Tax=Roseibium marinum TaxID=281252 RepID=A0A2S3US32_9HYPH|nr:hypothetical protein CLV41_106151 [Roseibium marinum]